MSMVQLLGKDPKHPEEDEVGKKNAVTTYDNLFFAFCLPVYFPCDRMRPPAEVRGIRTLPTSAV